MNDAQARILIPGQITAPTGEIPFLFLPQRHLFARRAERFRSLSPGHPLEGYLGFLALLADAQQEAFESFQSAPPPATEEQALGMPPLDASSWPRNPAWREGLELILRRMVEAPLPAATRETADDLLSTSETRLEELAELILAGDLATVPPGSSPLSPPRYKFTGCIWQRLWENRMSPGWKQALYARCAGHTRPPASCVPTERSRGCATSPAPSAPPAGTWCG